MMRWCVRTKTHSLKSRLNEHSNKQILEVNAPAILAVAVIVATIMLLQPTAHAADEQITIGMPFTGA